MIHTHVLNGAPLGFGEPRRSDALLIRLRRGEYHVPGNDQISRDVSPYIMPTGQGAFRKAAETRAPSG